MKLYNRSLDYITLAMAVARQGDAVKSAKLFAKAIASDDCVRAVAILEASNKQAFETTAAAKKAAVVAAAKKAVVASKPAAAKRIIASEEFDVGDDADLADLTDEVEEEGDEDEVEEVEEVEAVEDIEGDENFDEQFASVLASLVKKPARK